LLIVMVPGVVLTMVAVVRPLALRRPLGRGRRFRAPARARRRFIVGGAHRRRRE